MPIYRFLGDKPSTSTLEAAEWASLIHEGISFLVPGKVAAAVPDLEKPLKFWGSIQELFEDFLPTTFPSSQAFKIMVEHSPVRIEPAFDFMMLVTPDEAKLLLDPSGLIETDPLLLWR